MNSVVKEIKADKKKAEKEKSSRRTTTVKVFIVAAVVYTLGLVYKRTPFSMEIERLFNL